MDMRCSRRKQLLLCPMTLSKNVESVLTTLVFCLGIISERRTEIVPDSLAFGGLRRTSFNDFEVMVDKIFELSNVDETQGR